VYVSTSSTSSASAPRDADAWSPHASTGRLRYDHEVPGAKSAPSRIMRVRASAFVWLVCPGGYVGTSASLEIGVAIAANVPVFSTTRPQDLTLRHYVQNVSDIANAVSLVGEMANSPHASFLLDPKASLAEARDILERIRDTVGERPEYLDDTMTRRIYADRETLVRLLAPQWAVGAWNRATR